MPRTRFLSFTILLALPFGCAKKSEDTAVPANTEAASHEASTSEADYQNPGKAGIVIDPKIAALCSLPEAHFEFDSSALSESAKRTLEALTACFTTGPAADKSIRLVGHADPRGTAEYNLGLGQRRAGNVASYLSSQGFGEDRIESSSRGELDAAGSDEDSWAADRKVEIFLADE